MVILPATWRDLNALRQVERICFQKDSWPLLDLISVLTMPGIIRLKAVIDEEFIGFIAGDVRRSENLAWIATICVHPKHQRKGIGRALLNACEDQCDVPRVRLSVRTGNYPAIDMYRDMGYKQVGMWERYYQDGGNALLMEKELRL